VECQYIEKCSGIEKKQVSGEQLSENGSESKSFIKDVNYEDDEDDEELVFVTQPFQITHTSPLYFYSSEEEKGENDDGDVFVNVFVDAKINTATANTATAAAAATKNKSEHFPTVSSAGQRTTMETNNKMLKKNIPSK
jgi:hypothetical protein